MSDVNQTFTAIAAIQGLGLGAILGATGQGIRVIVGLKKAAESAQATGSTLRRDFNGPRLLVSLLVGAIAGVVAALPFISQAEAITYQTLVALLGAGYAGTDFIEAFMRRAVPDSSDSSLSPQTPQH
jgi:hypothetical protein